MSFDPLFRLSVYEDASYAADSTTALNELLQLLLVLEKNDSRINQGIEATLSAPLSPQAVQSHLLTRVALATGALMASPATVFDETAFQNLMLGHRWLSLAMATSPLGNADAILRGLLAQQRVSQAHQLDDAALFKFCLLYGGESQLNLDLDALWMRHRRVALTLAFCLLSPRLSGSEAAYSKRDTLLAWLSQKLGELGDMNELPQQMLHMAWMNCSYATGPNNHAIKAALNRLIRRNILAMGLGDLVAPQQFERHTGKPKLLLVPEWMAGRHSNYRTHSRSIAALRQRFHVVCMAREGTVDEHGAALFDELLFFQSCASVYDELRQIRALAERLRPAIAYYPGVGMSPISIYLANVRYAPLQLSSTGHAASTFCEPIDYFAVEQAYVADPRTFSEQLLVLPNDAMPHTMPITYTPIAPILRERPALVQIAVAATTIKFNPQFLTACSRIAQAAQTAQTPIHFHFLAGLSAGLIHTQLETLVALYLPGVATVHPHQDFPDYLRAMNQCDLCLNPFPYGNMNGIVDMAQQGLVGVCLDGPQLHQHIDAAMFAALGLPAWLTAKNEDAYVVAALRLIHNHDERLALRRDLLQRQAVQVFFKGQPQSLGERLFALLQGR